ncbi:hypothetical protein J6590_008275 [Homalodisca vitripennis]|nr:hypothetical protein J6590_008275 [Homalodisca vitripennis]
MRGAVVLTFCSLATAYLNTNCPKALNGWPKIHPPPNFKPNPAQGDLPPYHTPSLQSPINIRSSKAAKVKLSPLKFENMLNDGVRVIMRNTGTTVQFEIANESVMAPRLVGGPLTCHGEYEFSNLHVHWGTEDNLGGEHEINDRRFAIEGHCVHFKKKYQTIEEAEKHSDGLAVVAFFAKAGDVDNPKIDRLVELLPSIRYPNSSVTLAARDSLDWFDELAEPFNYFTCPGSLTTPPYTENVFWIVYPRPMSVSSRQVKAFRNLLSNDLMVNRENIRPVQPFNSRPLIYSVPKLQ